MRLWPFRSKRARALSYALDPTYDWPLNDVLLRWGPKEPFSFREAMAGILILGAIGSGKSSGSGQHIAMAMLMAGFGMLVLCAKPDEADVWENYAIAAGREADFIRFTADGPWKFDPLDYELQRSGPGAGHTENLVGILTTLLEIADRNGGQGHGGGQNEAFWKHMLKQLLRNLIDLIVIAKGRCTVTDLSRLVMSAPMSMADVRSPEWRSSSYLFKCLLEADSAPKTPRQEHDLGLVADYWLMAFPNLDPKPRSTVVASLSAMIDCLCRGVLRERFSDGTNITPACIEEGKIVVVDINVREYGEIGLFSAILWKYAFQRHIERRNVVDSPRPVTLWVDEAQNFLTTFDMQFQGTCRAAKCSTVLLSQNLSNFYATLGGGESGKAISDSLLGNLNLKIFHANGDHVTNEWALATIGNSKHLLFNGNSQHGNESAADLLMGRGASQTSAGLNESIQADVEPSEFTKLRCGGEANRWLVDAILFANGTKFRATGKPYVYTTFRQR